MKAVFFDLDGTLLDTLKDIGEALNDALSKMGLPMRYSREEVRSFIGRGTDILCHKALGHYDDEANFHRLKELYMPLYGQYQLLHSEPYPEMPKTLATLKDMGLSLYVFSNKPDPLAKAIVHNFYGSTFEEVQGALDNRPKKPDPTLLIEMLNRHGLTKEDILYVGDSLPDIELSEALGCHDVLCLWGYGKYTTELLKRADYVIDKPLDLIKAVKAG